MIDLFLAGNPFYMTLITLAGVAALVYMVKVLSDWKTTGAITRQKLNGIPIAGSLAFMLGLLAQTIGLYQAMRAIERAGDVSPTLIFGGFKVSLIAPIYGLIIFVITLAIWLALVYYIQNSPNAER